MGGSAGTAGTPPACEDGSECDDSEPICDEGTCRGCEEHSECVSLVCRPDGACEDASAVVYALAATGSSDTECGSFDEPCLLPSVAATHLSAARPFLVFIQTPAAFEDFDAMELPDGVDVTILGNLVEIVAANARVVTANGGIVQLDELVATSPVAGAGIGSSVHMVGGTLRVRDSTIEGNQVGIYASETDLHVEGSVFIHNTDVGILNLCDGCDGLGSPVIERNRFEGIPVAIAARVPGTVIRNNLFVEVATSEYSQGVLLEGDMSTLEFNTFIRSGCCSNTGLIRCGDAALGALLRGNITFLSTTLSEDGTGPCYDQVYVGCPNPTYSLSEVTFPGAGNVAGDPGFVDDGSGDYRLTSDSIAVDLVQSSDGPDDDYDGNPRPVGDDRDAGAFERQ